MKKYTSSFSPVLFYYYIHKIWYKYPSAHTKVIILNQSTDAIAPWRIFSTTYMEHRLKISYTKSAELKNEIRDISRLVSEFIIYVCTVYEVKLPH